VTASGIYFLSVPERTIRFLEFRTQQVRVVEKIVDTHGIAVSPDE
jgi:hypothetical protein